MYECRVVVDSMENDKHGTIINNVRLCYVLDPKRYTKKIPAGAISWQRLAYDYNEYGELRYGIIIKSYSVGL